MSRHHRQGKLTRLPSPEEATTLMNVAHQYCHDQNNLMERTAEVVTFMTGYLVNRMETLAEGLDNNTPFSMRLKNRTNHIVKSCEEFLAAMEPYIKGEDKRQAYLEVVDIVFPMLDRLFDDIHRDEKNPSMKLVRRAKLRYHDPYREHVAEQTAAFEDGYCKGYKDCVADIHRELAAIKDDGDTQAVIDIVDGQVNIRTLQNREGE